MSTAGTSGTPGTGGTAADAVTRLTGRSVASTRGGGSVTRCVLDDGTEVVAKTGEPSAVAAEAAGLRWLAEPSAVAVPAVLGALEEAGLRIASVTVGRPSLDDVYLRHVGRSFEVAA
jgi:hypothetical protein